MDKKGRFFSFPKSVENRLWKVKNFVEENRIMSTNATFSMDRLKNKPSKAKHVANPSDQLIGR